MRVDKVMTWKTSGALILTLFLFAAPQGIQAQDEWDDWDDAVSPVELHGMAEYVGGGRLVADATQPDDILANEARFRLDLSRYSDRAEFYFKGDLIADGVADDVDVDIRRAAVLLRAMNWLDVTVGRQVLTWGTGDLVFLNDAFPKDFVSFFIGRDDEFLKLPTNSLRAMAALPFANVDLAWTPTFTPDAYITGERLSYHSPMKPGITSAAESGAIDARLPDKTWRNGSFAGRLYRRAGGYEVAGYVSYGFWNQPTAVDMADTVLTFADLGVYGGSVRGNLLGGIANVEVAYYDSMEDRDGTNPFVPNSQWRGLAGYERELMRDFSGAFQYYSEQTDNYEALMPPSADAAPVETRHVVTARLTRLLAQQTWIVSLFGYYSPNEEDGYVRPVVTHRWSDDVTVALGANIMWGDEFTFFGQLEDNTNAYLRVRYSF